MLANRIDPLGQFATTPRRGGFMGNRGRLHSAEGAITRRWQTRAWITCTLREKPGRPGIGVTPPNSYTRLFFLDEAVACAAGHRPCAECRRAHYRAFRAAWEAAYSPVQSVKEIDAVLHTARLQGPHQCEARELPEGAFLLHEGRPHLLTQDRILPYTSGTYGPPLKRPEGTIQALTTAPMLAAMRAGWQPCLTPENDHPNW